MMLSDLGAEVIRVDRKSAEGQGSKFNVLNRGRRSIAVDLKNADGVETVLIEGVPVSDAIAKELGYGRVLWRIDPKIWMSRKAEMWDTNGNALKTVVNEDFREIAGIWTAHTIRVENHKTGHKTVFTFSNVNYEDEVSPNLFEQRSLKRR